MANQRKKGIERITLTLPDSLLEQVEAEVSATGSDRLSVIREAISEYITARKAAKATKRAARKKPK